MTEQTDMGERLERLAGRNREMAERIESLENSLEAAKDRADRAESALREGRAARLEAQRRADSAEPRLREAQKRVSELEAMRQEDAERHDAAVTEARMALAAQAGAEERAGEAMRRVEELEAVIEEDAPAANADMELLRSVRAKLKLDDSDDLLEALDELLLTDLARRGRIRELMARVGEVETELEETKGNLEERQGWANLTQGELDALAAVLGVEKDAPHGAVLEALVGLLADRDRLAEEGAGARAKADELRGELNEARRARDVAASEDADEPHGPTRARARGFLDVARVVGLNGHSPVEQVVERVRELATPRAEVVGIDDGADFRRLLFAALLAKLEAGEASEDMLDRLERLADWPPAP